MRFKRGVLLVLMLLGCLCVPAGAVDGIDEAAKLFEVVLTPPDYGKNMEIEIDSDVEIYSYSVSSEYHSLTTVYFDHFEYGTAGCVFTKPVKLSAGVHILTCGVATQQGHHSDFTVTFYGKGKPSEPEPEPVTPVNMISTLPKELLTDTMHLTFSKPITGFKCSLVDASGVSIGLTTSVNGSVGTVQITDKAFKAGLSYTFKLTDATAEDGGKLDKPYTHTFQAVPEEPPEPEKPPKFFLKSSLPDYLLKNSISLEFSSPVKDLSVHLLDEAGQEVATQVAISGSSATVHITDAAFQSGQPYTFKLLGATAEDGGKLENPISHSFKEMISSGNQGFDMVFMGILSMFSESKTQGLIIVILAVFVGLIFVLGRWLWAMSKFWLRRAKY